MASHTSLANLTTTGTTVTRTTEVERVEFHKNGYCPYHPDIQLRKRGKIFRRWKTILRECPRCASEFLVQQLVQLQSTAGSQAPVSVIEHQGLRGEDRSQASSITAPFQQQHRNTTALPPALQRRDSVSTNNDDYMDCWEDNPFLTPPAEHKRVNNHSQREIASHSDHECLETTSSHLETTSITLDGSLQSYASVKVNKPSPPVSRESSSSSSECMVSPSETGGFPVWDTNIGVQKSFETIPEMAESKEEETQNLANGHMGLLLQAAALSVLVRAAHHTPSTRSSTRQAPLRRKDVRMVRPVDLTGEKMHSQTLDEMAAMPKTAVESSQEVVVEGLNYDHDNADTKMELVNTTIADKPQELQPHRIEACSIVKNMERSEGAVDDVKASEERHASVVTASQKHLETDQSNKDTPSSCVAIAAKEMNLSRRVPKEPAEACARRVAQDPDGDNYSATMVALENQTNEFVSTNGTRCITIDSIVPAADSKVDDLGGVALENQTNDLVPTDRNRCITIDSMVPAADSKVAGEVGSLTTTENQSGSNRVSKLDGNVSLEKSSEEVNEITDSPSGVQIVPPKGVTGIMGEMVEAVVNAVNCGIHQPSVDALRTDSTSFVHEEQHGVAFPITLPSAALTERRLTMGLAETKNGDLESTFQQPPCVLDHSREVGVDDSTNVPTTDVVPDATADVATRLSVSPQITRESDGRVPVEHVNLHTLRQESVIDKVDSLTNTLSSPSASESGRHQVEDPIDGGTILDPELETNNHDHYTFTSASGYDGYRQQVAVSNNMPLRHEGNSSSNTAVEDSSWTNRPQIDSAAVQPHEESIVAETVSFNEKEQKEADSQDMAFHHRGTSDHTEPASIPDDRPPLAESIGDRPGSTMISGSKMALKEENGDKDHQSTSFISSDYFDPQEQASSDDMFLRQGGSSNRREPNDREMALPFPIASVSDGIQIQAKSIGDCPEYALISGTCNKPKEREMKNDQYPTMSNSADCGNLQEEAISNHMVLRHPALSDHTKPADSETSEPLPIAFVSDDKPPQVDSIGDSPELLEEREMKQDQHRIFSTSGDCENSQSDSNDLVLRQAVTSDHIERGNSEIPEPVPTASVSGDKPHLGNHFDDSPETALMSDDCIVLEEDEMRMDGHPTIAASGDCGKLQQESDFNDMGFRRGTTSDYSEPADTTNPFPIVSVSDDKLHHMNSFGNSPESTMIQDVSNMLDEDEIKMDPDRATPASGGCQNPQEEDGCNDMDLRIADISDHTEQESTLIQDVSNKLEEGEIKKDQDLAMSASGDCENPQEEDDCNDMDLRIGDISDHTEPESTLIQDVSNKLEEGEIKKDQDLAMSASGDCENPQEEDDCNDMDFRIEETSDHTEPSVSEKSKRFPVDSVSDDIPFQLNSIGDSPESALLSGVCSKQEEADIEMDQHPTISAVDWEDSQEEADCYGVVLRNGENSDHTEPADCERLPIVSLSDDTPLQVSFIGDSPQSTFLSDVCRKQEESEIKMTKAPTMSVAGDCEDSQDEANCDLVLSNGAASDYTEPAVSEIWLPFPTSDDFNKLEEDDMEMDPTMYAAGDCDHRREEADVDAVNMVLRHEAVSDQTVEADSEMSEPFPISPVPDETSHLVNSIGNSPESTLLSDVCKLNNDEMERDQAADCDDMRLRRGGTSNQTELADSEISEPFPIASVSEDKQHQVNSICDSPESTLISDVGNKLVEDEIKMDQNQTMSASGDCENPQEEADCDDMVLCSEAASDYTACAVTEMSQKPCPIASISNNISTQVNPLGDSLESTLISDDCNKLGEDDMKMDQHPKTVASGDEPGESEISDAFPIASVSNDTPPQVNPVDKGPDSILISDVCDELEEDEIKNDQDPTTGMSALDDCAVSQDEADCDDIVLRQREISDQIEPAVSEMTEPFTIASVSEDKPSKVPSIGDSPGSSLISDDCNKLEAKLEDCEALQQEASFHDMVLSEPAVVSELTGDSPESTSILDVCSKLEDGMETDQNSAVSLSGDCEDPQEEPDAVVIALHGRGVSSDTEPVVSEMPVPFPGAYDADDKPPQANSIGDSPESSLISDACNNLGEDDMTLNQDPTMLDSGDGENPQDEADSGDICLRDGGASDHTECPVSLMSHPIYVAFVTGEKATQVNSIGDNLRGDQMIMDQHPTIAGQWEDPQEDGVAVDIPIHAENAVSEKSLPFSIASLPGDESSTKVNSIGEISESALMSYVYNKQEEDEMKMVENPALSAPGDSEARQEGVHCDDTALRVGPDCDDTALHNGEFSDHTEHIVSEMSPTFPCASVSDVSRQANSSGDSPEINLISAVCNNKLEDKEMDGCSCSTMPAGDCEDSLEAADLDDMVLCQALTSDNTERAGSKASLSIPAVSGVENLEGQTTDALFGGNDLPKLSHEFERPVNAGSLSSRDGSDDDNLNTSGTRNMRKSKFGAFETYPGASLKVHELRDAAQKEAGHFEFSLDDKIGSEEFPLPSNALEAECSDEFNRVDLEESLEADIQRNVDLCRIIHLEKTKDSTSEPDQKGVSLNDPASFDEREEAPPSPVHSFRSQDASDYSTPRQFASAFSAFESELKTTACEDPTRLNICCSTDDTQAESVLYGIDEGNENEEQVERTLELSESHAVMFIPPLEAYDDDGPKVLETRQFHNGSFEKENVSATDDVVQEMKQHVVLGLVGNNNLRNKIAFVDEGGIDSVLLVMNWHKTEIPLQELGSAISLSVMSNNDAIVETFVESGGIQAIVKAMKRFPKHPGIQEQGCGTIWNLLASKTFDTKIGFRKVGGVNCLIAALVNMNQHASVVEQACGACWNLISGESPEPKTEFAEKGGMECLIAAMTANKSHEQIQEYACGAALRLMACHEESVNVFAEHGGIDAIMSAIENFNDKPAVLLQAYGAAWHFMRDNGTRTAVFADESIDDSEGIECVIEVMKENEFCSDIDEADVRKGRITVSVSNDRRDMFASAGGLLWLIDTLQHHTLTNVGLLEQCLRTTIHFISESITYKNAFAHAGGVQHVVDGMQQHSSDRVIQQLGCEVLLSLSVVDNIFSGLNACDVLSVLQAARGSFSSEFSENGSSIAEQDHL